MTTLYREIENLVRSSGYHTSFQDDDDGGRLVCVTNRAPQGSLYGNSFWIADRKDRLYLGNMWGDRLYVIGRRDRVPELCLACLCQSSTPLTEPSDTICSEFQLVEVPLGDFLCDSPSLAE